MEEKVNHWIVIVATACYGYSTTLGTNVVIPTIDTGSSSSVYRPVHVNPPQLYVFKAKSRAEAEELAIGYRMASIGDSMSIATQTREPSPFGCAESAVVVSPDGKAYTVVRLAKTKKVMREVEEPDGTETIWAEQP